MADRSRTVWKKKTGLVFCAEWGEVEVSLDDTVTFDSMKSTEDLLNVVFWKQSDGAEMTSTKSYNVATITGSGTNIDCVYMVYGYKA